MLRTRLWMGALLIALVVALLIGDQWLAPWYPVLFVLVLGLGLLASYELLHLLDGDVRPPAWLSYLAVAGLITANWPAHLAGPFEWPAAWADPWHWVLTVFVAVVLAAFLAEMATFREPGRSVVRIALTLWIAAYLGLLPGFLVQLRWLDDTGSSGLWALVLAIFVPKACDSGAYFTGRWLGRHPMTPVLSPKKTWEGLAGGLLAAIAATAGINYFAQVLPGGVLAVVGFGLTVGGAGVLGDLAESLIKRDCRQKDASTVVPGFGGVLDVVDAILFAAPVAYWWLR